MTDKPRAYRISDWPEFLQVINRLRRERKLTVRALAAQVGGSHQHLGNQLLGKVLPLVPFVWALANALGYDIALIPRQPEEEP